MGGRERPRDIAGLTRWLLNSRGTSARDARDEPSSGGTEPCSDVGTSRTDWGLCDYIQNKNNKNNALNRYLAEREGFEPSMGFHPYTLSRRAP